jgi:hypothetical protein
MTQPAIGIYHVKLPLPYKEFSPNYLARSVTHQIRRNKLKKRYRQECAVILAAARIPALGAITLHTAFYLWKGDTQAERYARSAYYFPMDSANALSSIKAAIDALQDAGIIENDDSLHLKIGSVTLYRHKHNHEHRSELIFTIDPGY